MTPQNADSSGDDAPSAEESIGYDDPAPAPAEPGVADRDAPTVEDADESHSDTEPDAAAPALSATGLGLRTREGWVFRGVTFTAEAGRVTALAGPDGSGKSSLLLALTGRMAPTEGTLTLSGRSVLADPRTARQRTAVARAADIVAPEGQLTVAESVAERCLIEGARRRDGAAAFDAACEVMALRFDTASLVEHLPPRSRALLAVALACVRPADVIVLDDTDRGVTDAGEREIYRALGALAGTGLAIVTTTTRPEPARQVLSGGDGGQAAGGVIPLAGDLDENGVIPLTPAADGKDES